MLSLLKIYTSDRTSNQRLCEPEYLYINTCIGHLSYWGWICGYCNGLYQINLSYELGILMNTMNILFGNDYDGIQHV